MIVGFGGSGNKYGTSLHMVFSLNSKYNKLPLKFNTGNGAAKTDSEEFGEVAGLVGSDTIQPH
jgi:hypothetical protein